MRIQWLMGFRFRRLVIPKGGVAAVGNTGASGQSGGRLITGDRLMRRFERAGQLLMFAIPSP